MWMDAGIVFSILRTAAAQEMAGLVEKIQQQVHVLFQLSESVALLDMMAAFGAHVKLAGGDWARPRMDGSASASLVLKQAMPAYLPTCLPAYLPTYLPTLPLPSIPKDHAELHL